MVIDNALFILLILYTLGYILAALCILYWELFVSKDRFAPSSLMVTVVLSALSWYAVYLFVQSIKQLQNQNNHETLE